MSLPNHLSDVADIVRLSEYRSAKTKSATSFTAKVSFACAKVRAVYNPARDGLRYYSLLFQLDLWIKASQHARIKELNSTIYKKALLAVLKWLTEDVLNASKPNVTPNLSTTPPIGQNIDDIYSLIHILGKFLERHSTMGSGVLVMLTVLVRFARKRNAKEDAESESEIDQDIQVGNKRKAPHGTVVRTTEAIDDVSTNKDSDGGVCVPSNPSLMNNRRTTRSRAKSNTFAVAETEPPNIDNNIDNSIEHKLKRLKTEETTDSDIIYDETELLKTEETTDSDSIYTEETTDSDSIEHLKIEETTDGEREDIIILSDEKKYETCHICKIQLSTVRRMNTRFDVLLAHVTQKHLGHPGVALLSKYMCNYCGLLFSTEIALNLHASKSDCLRPSDTSKWEVYTSQESHAPPTKWSCPTCPTRVTARSAKYKYTTWIERLWHHLGRKHGHRLIVSCSDCPGTTLESIEAMIEHRKNHGIAQYVSHGKPLNFSV
ncbi:hypothetical protein TWF718_009679 [Orbilia javanica]|uniref:Uncharacterized protein n=1 Tax=Orbilia javanica TaxID=47235 RepID=A0AAN8MTQ4_9PEZI